MATKQKPAPEHDEQFVMLLTGGIEAMQRHPELLGHVGRYLCDYQPEYARKGKQWIWTTPDVDKAMGFDEFRELHQMYQYSVGFRAWDGKPDRPISAYHIRVARRKEFKD